MKSDSLVYQWKKTLSKLVQTYRFLQQKMKIDERRTKISCPKVDVITRKADSVHFNVILSNENCVYFSTINILSMLIARISIAFLSNDSPIHLMHCSLAILSFSFPLNHNLINFAARFSPLCPCLTPIYFVVLITSLRWQNTREKQNLKSQLKSIETKIIKLSTHSVRWLFSFWHFSSRPQCPARIGEHQTNCNQIKIKYKIIKIKKAADAVPFNEDNFSCI